MRADTAGAPKSFPPARTGVAWALYDWANSAFTTLVVTFVYAAYFTAAIAPDEVTGTGQWSRAVAVSGITIALLSPLLGAMADRSGHRRRYLAAATWVCCAATAALTFASPGMEHAVLLALALFTVANVAFELGGVFYNAFLPEIAPKERMGRMSGWAWGLGYAGGLACLALALLVLVRDDPLFGVSTEAGFNYRATNLLVAASGSWCSACHCWRWRPGSVAARRPARDPPGLTAPSCTRCASFAATGRSSGCWSRVSSTTTAW